MEVLYVIGWLFCAGLAAGVGERRNATSQGFIVGLFFGPLGVVAMLGIDRRPVCPRCHGRLNLVRNQPPQVCPWCGIGQAVAPQPQYYPQHNVPIATPVARRVQ